MSIRLTTRLSLSLASPQACLPLAIPTSWLLFSTFRGPRHSTRLLWGDGKRLRCSCSRLKMMSSVRACALVIWLRMLLSWENRRFRSSVIFVPWIVCHPRVGVRESSMATLGLVFLALRTLLFLTTQCTSRLKSRLATRTLVGLFSMKRSNSPLQFRCQTLWNGRGRHRMPSLLRLLSHRRLVRFQFGQFSKPTRPGARP